MYWTDRYLAIGRVDGVDGPDTIFLDSQDGKHWALTDRQASGGTFPGRVVGTRDRVLAASLRGGANAGLWTSDDGYAWEPVHSATWTGTWSDGTPRDIAAGPLGFVAVGVRDVGLHLRQAAIVHSTDGRTWTVVDQPELFDDADLQGVVAFRGGYVIAGTDRRSAGARLAVWQSDDGLVWRRSEVESTEPWTSGTIRLLVGKDGLALVSSGREEVMSWSSADGTTWSRVLQPEWKGVATLFAADGTRMVVLGLRHPVGEAVGWVSTDGMGWKELRIPGTPDVMLETFPEVPRDLAIGRTGIVVWATHDVAQVFQDGWAVGH